MAVGYWLMYVSARQQLQCHVCHPPRAVDVRGLIVGYWLTRTTVDREGTQRASDGREAAKGWFWRREMILSEWRRKGHNTRRSWHPEHKWGDPIEMVELGSENDWVASERLTRNESGNRTMHYSTSSPRRWMQACFKFIASVHFNALLQPRLHRPLFLAPPPLPPPPPPPPPFI